MYEYRANITAVVDASTLEADIDLGFNFVVRNQRLTIRDVGLSRADSIPHQRAFIMNWLDAYATRGSHPGRGVIIHVTRCESRGAWIASVRLERSGASLADAIALEARARG